MQITNGQTQRLNQIRENRRLFYGGMGELTSDIDFLLSLVKSQEAVGDYSKLAHEIISEYNNADNPGLLRQKVAEGFARVAASMRSACVEKVKAFFGGLTSKQVNLDDLVELLESVSIQEQKLFPCGAPRPDDGSECAFGFCPRPRDGCSEYCWQHHRSQCAIQDQEAKQ